MELWTNLGFENLHDWADGLKDLHQMVDETDGGECPEELKKDLPRYANFLVLAVVAKVDAETKEFAYMMELCKGPGEPLPLAKRTLAQGPPQYCFDAIPHIDNVLRWVGEFNDALAKIIGGADSTAVNNRENAFALVGSICTLAHVRGVIMSLVSVAKEGQVIPGAFPTFSEDTVTFINTARHLAQKGPTTGLSLRAPMCLESEEDMRTILKEIERPLTQRIATALVAQPEKQEAVTKAQESLSALRKRCVAAFDAWSILGQGHDLTSDNQRQGEVRQLVNVMNGNGHPASVQVDIPQVFTWAPLEVEGKSHEVHFKWIELEVAFDKALHALETAVGEMKA